MGSIVAKGSRGSDGIFILTCFSGIDGFPETPIHVGKGTLEFATATSTRCEHDRCRIVEVAIAVRLVLGMLATLATNRRHHCEEKLQPPKPQRPKTHPCALAQDSIMKAVEEDCGVEVLATT